MSLYPNTINQRFFISADWEISNSLVDFIRIKVFHIADDKLACWFAFLHLHSRLSYIYFHTWITAFLYILIVLLLMFIVISDNNNAYYEPQCEMIYCIKTQQNSLIAESWPGGWKSFFMLSSAEHEICPANKSQITNNCKFFLIKHSWAWK